MREEPGATLLQPPLTAVSETRLAVGTQTSTVASTAAIRVVTLAAPCNTATFLMASTPVDWFGERLDRVGSMLVHDWSDRHAVEVMTHGAFSGGGSRAAGNLSDPRPYDLGAAQCG